jgi:acetyl esterase
MILDPEAERVLEMIRLSGRLPLASLTPAEGRAVFNASKPVLQPDQVAVGAVRDLAAPGPAGPVPLRLYRAAGTAEGQVLPVLIYYHGGGWVLGDLDSHDGICRRLANDSGGCVVAVDYRLAPEHKFPAAVADSAAATRWIIEQADQLRIDASRVAVGGDSAGGNLAAVMALMARDGYLPAVHWQLLIYPATDMAMVSRSVNAFPAGYPLTTGAMRWFIDHYLRGPEDVVDWRASPLRAVSLAGVAPAFVITCDHDPLADEGGAYAARLVREGVRTSHLNIADQMHGFLHMGRLIRASDTLLLIMATAMKARWAELEIA